MKKQMILIPALAAACVMAQPHKAETQHFEMRTFGSGPMGVEAMMGGTVKGQPYSADVVSESVQALADGTRISNKSGAFVARDSQGRTRHEAKVNVMGNAASNDMPKIVMIHDPQTQVTYTLEERSKTARKMSSAPLPLEPAKGAGPMMTTVNVEVIAGGEGHAGARVMQYKVRQGGMGRKEALGSKMIEGVMADGARITETIPAGEIGNDREIQVVNEVWTAQELKAVVYSKRTDPRTGEMIYRLTNIQRSEPAASLFEVPADYKIQEGVPENVTIIRHKD